MIYSDIFVKKQVKIPTLLSIPIILFISYFLGRLVLTPAKNIKAVKQNVQKVQVSNIYSNQVTIIWQTDIKEEGWIIYGENKNNLSNITFDSRDEAEKKEAFRNHFVPLKNLKENTTYYFKIAGKDGLASRSNNEPFDFKTLKKGASISNSKPAYGKVIGRNNSPLENALVVLTIESSLPLSVLSKSTGEWLIPLNYTADSKTGDLKILSGKEIVKLQIISEQEEVSNIETVVSNLNPFPETIIIGKDYLLLEKQEVLAAATQNKKEVELDIVFPKANAVIPDNKPLIKGVAKPNSELRVSVTDGKTKTTKKVFSDKDGQWKMDLSTPLSQGQHVLEVVSGAGGTAQTQKRTFTVAKSGESVLGEATAEPTLQATQSPTPTTTTTAAATITPTPPVSGSNFFYLTLSSIALIAVGLSILIYGLL